MESPRHWYSILGELVVKCLEGVLSVRLPKPVLRRFMSGDRNEILQTIVPDTASMRNREVKCSLDWNWTLALSLYAGVSQQQTIERWQFTYVVAERSKREDLYRQASTSLRSVLCLALLLPAYYKYREGWKLGYELDGQEDWGHQRKNRQRLKMFETVAGTLYLEVLYAAKIELLSPSKLQRAASGKSLESHPLSQWGLATLSESDDSDEELPRYRPIHEPDTLDLSEELRALIEVNASGHLSMTPSSSNRVSLGMPALRPDPLMARMEKALLVLPNLLPERPLKEDYFELVALQAALEQDPSVTSCP